MPIYEYRCTRCGERFEALVSLAERESVRCPRGHGGSAERLLSSFAIASSSAAAPATGSCGSHPCACRVPEE